MKTLTFFFSILVSLQFVNAGSFEDRHNHQLYYTAPATIWEETLPLGNGRLGMMPDGGVDREHIVLNEISLWSGMEADYGNPDASRSLPAIQQLLFEGKNKEAQELMYSSFVPKKPESGGTYGNYQMLADPLMILVNHTNKMPENYTFETAECGSKTAVNKTLQTVACNAFLELQKAAAAENVTVWMQSGYRRVSYQTNLYEKKTNYYKQQGYDDAKAKEMAAAIVNPPGYSEHNCGLAADLNSPEHTGLDEGFENTAAFRWLCQHAGEYGFILRYPKGAEEKTEITYEPWHWRYVGVENAAKINASGLCFEDYIAALQQIAG